MEKEASRLISGEKLSTTQWQVRDFCKTCDLFNSGTNLCVLLEPERQVIRVRSGACPEATQARVEGTMTLKAFKPNHPTSPLVSESAPLVGDEY